MKKSTEIVRTAVEDMVPPWVMAMRNAAQKHLTERDVEDIVKGQVDRAKKGDRGAIRFVFDQLMGGAAFKGATFVQNNNYGDLNPSTPTTARPGSAKKIELMRRRVEGGLDVLDPDDASGDDGL